MLLSAISEELHYQQGAKSLEEVAVGAGPVIYTLCTAWGKRIQIQMANNSHFFHYDRAITYQSALPNRKSSSKKYSYHSKICLQPCYGICLIGFRHESSEQHGIVHQMKNNQPYKTPNFCIIME